MYKYDTFIIEIKKIVKYSPIKNKKTEYIQIQI